MRHFSIGRGMTRLPSSYGDCEESSELLLSEGANLPHAEVSDSETRLDGLPCKVSSIDGEQTRPRKKHARRKNVRFFQAKSTSAVFKQHIFVMMVPPFEGTTWSSIASPSYPGTYISNPWYRGTCCTNPSYPGPCMANSF